MRTDTKIYNDPNQCELLYAVVLNNVEETKELLAKIEDKSLLEDIGLLSKPFPLHYISLCNEAIWRYVDEWKNKEEAARFRDKSRAMVEFWKVPSGEITNYPYLLEIAKTGLYKEMILSSKYT